MSCLRVENSLLSLIGERTQSCCSNTKILKIFIFALGLLLIGGAIASHISQVNAIATYIMGSVGGILILSIAIASIVQCISRRFLELTTREESIPTLQQPDSANDDLGSPSFYYRLEDAKPNKKFLLEKKSKWYELARKGDNAAIGAIEEILQGSIIGPVVHDSFNPTLLLHAAVSEGHVELVKLLLKHEADSMRTSRYDELGYTALHLAITCRNPQNGLIIMQILLDNNRDLINIKPSHSESSPLQFVQQASLGDKAIKKQQVELLIKYGVVGKST